MTNYRKQFNVYIVVLTISVIAGYIYMSTGFDRAPGGDDKDFFVRMYLETKDYSYFCLMIRYLKESFYHMIHPRLTDRYYCLTTMNYAVWKLASKSLTHYRAIILVYTCAAILLTVVMVWLITENIGMAVASSALFPLTVNIFAFVETNALYTYQTIIQRTYIFWALSMICTIMYKKRHRVLYLFFSLVLMFFSCMVLEVGYLLIFTSFFIMLSQSDNLKETITAISPQILAVLVAGIGYLICLSSNGSYGEGDTTVVLNISDIIRTSFWQMESSFGIIPILYSGYEFHLGYISIADLVVSVLLSFVLTFIVVYYEKEPTRLSGRQKLFIYLASLSMIIGPACLIGIVGKFQQGGFVQKDHGWIVSIIQNFGGVLALTVLLNGWLCIIKNRIRSRGVRAALLVTTVFAFTMAGSFSRCCAIAASEKNRVVYEMMQDSFSYGSMSEVEEGDTVCCNFYVWGTDERAQSNFILANSGKSVMARVYEGQLLDGDDWYACYHFNGETLRAFLYVGRINTDINDLTDVSLWVEAQSKESLQSAEIVCVNKDVETSFSVEESGIINLNNGRFGYLVNQSKLVDENITFIGVR